MDSGKNSKQEWMVTTNRFVAFIDIMGFKDMVLKSTHEEIYSMMKKINQQSRENEDIPWVSNEGKLVKTTTYSDSIIMYSKDDSESSLRSIAHTVSGLTNDLLEEGIPHKGAFSFGMMTLDTTNSIFFGQPLIDAFLLQEELNFYGIIIHASAEKEILKHKKLALFTKGYLCPLKNGNSFHLTILPMFLEESTDAEDDQDAKDTRKKLYDSLNKFRLMTSGHLRKYIDNTENYFEFVNKK